eukprot:GHVP01034366.1.p1 GENE.GHVP01034366.1~~GHVP01034366.1.p1  ORF type:complete len:307 (-),score=56.17 GHVP01034366.1:768-1688(-)
MPKNESSRPGPSRPNPIARHQPRNYCEKSSASTSFIEDLSDDYIMINGEKTLMKDVAETIDTTFTIKLDLIGKNEKAKAKEIFQMKFLDEDKNEICKIRIPKTALNLKRTTICFWMKGYFIKDFKHSNLKSLCEQARNHEVKFLLQPLLEFSHVVCEKKDFCYRLSEEEDTQVVSWNTNDTRYNADKMLKFHLCPKHVTFVYPENFNPAIQRLRNIREEDCHLNQSEEDSVVEGFYKNKFEVEISNQTYEIYVFTKIKYSKRPFIYVKDLKNPYTFFKINHEYTAAFAKDLKDIALWPNLDFSSAI